MPTVDPKMIDGILLSYTSVMTLGWTGLTPAALWLLSQVATWYLIGALLLSLTHVEHKLVEFVYKCTLYMVYVWVLTHMRFLTNALADTLVRVGTMMSTPAAVALGVPPLTVEQFMMPSHVILKGWDTTLPLYVFLSGMSSSWYAALQNFFAILIYDLGALMPMWVCFNLMAIHIIVVVVLFQMVALFGLLFIPFALYRGSAWLASGAINGVIATGVRLGTLAFITGVQMPWIAHISIQPAPGAEIGIWSALSASLVALAMVIVSWHAPKAAAAYFGRDSGLSATTVVGAALGAGAAFIRR